MIQTRREFIRTCAGVCAVGALAYLGIGCADNTGGNSSGGPQSFSINLADYPALEHDNGAVSVGSNPLGRPLLVTHTSGEIYYALDSQCTHQGCTVAATLPTLNCPCHGSRFSLSGAVVIGPAARPLSSFTVHKNGNTLTIDLP